MIRLSLNRQQFVELVAGKTLRSRMADTSGLDIDVELSLDLNRSGSGSLADYTDPPEAREFLKRPRTGQPR